MSGEQQVLDLWLCSWCISSRGFSRVTIKINGVIGSNEKP